MNKKGIVIIVLALIATIFITLLVVNKKSEDNLTYSDDTTIIAAIKASVLSYIDEINLEVSTLNIDENFFNDIDDGIYTVQEMKSLGISRKSKVLTDGWVKVKNGQVVDYSICYIFKKTYFVSDYISEDNTSVEKEGKLRPQQ